MSSTAPDHIFFYGTLMRGFDLRARTQVDRWLQFIGRGTIRGALFDLGPYPAAIPAEGRVSGELYAVNDPAALLARVDTVEGYVSGDRASSQYTRERVAVDLDRDRVLAWAYFYARPLRSAVWIPSGDYRQHLSRQV